MFSSEQIRRIGKELGWEYAVLEAEIKIPDDIIEEFIEDIPILELHLKGELSKDINDKFKGFILHKQFLKYHNNTFDHIYIPRIPGRRNNLF